MRNAMPWAIRWILGAVILGFSASIGLWAFEFGREIAGLDSNAKDELKLLRAEVVQLRLDREKALTIANTAGLLQTAEKAAQEKMAAQLQQLEAVNLQLRDDLGFFERLLPAGGGDGVSIRGLQAELMSATQLRWQILVIQPVKNAPEFNGKLDLTINGLLAGKPWTMTLPGGAQALQFKQYRRIEGVLDLPPQVVVKTVTAKVVEGSATRSVQTFKF